MMSSAFARFVFYPSLAYNVVMEKISSRQWYNKVDNHVILGALPLRSMSHQLVNEENVKGVVSLNEDYELRYLANQPEEWKKLGVDNIHFKVVDMFEAPSQEMLIEGVDFINRKSVDGGVVYVHCKAGRSRSATLVTCYLMKKHNWTPEEAISHLKSIRPHVIFTPGKMEALNIFYQNQVAVGRVES
uniref:Phosphatidylglycerophosphatase and protein-tyrosine phosphatase 1 n=1 Tax=Eubosmina coregoni TaxID=186181 RepID=A0A4Y7LPR5_9CRUS|nr:EOG090X0GSS [Eubosmina coregoni]SVE70144.1 EOG090X0GSS [Eubosmina coregoni]